MSTFNFNQKQEKYNQLSILETGLRNLKMIHLCVIHTKAEN